MGLLEDLNQRVRKFDFVDIKLAQFCAFFLALVIAKIIPDLMDISIWWFIVLLILCAIKPFCVFWFAE